MVRELFIAPLSGFADKCRLPVCAHGGHGLELLRPVRSIAGVDAGAVFRYWRVTRNELKAPLFTPGVKPDR